MVSEWYLNGVCEWYPYGIFSCTSQWNTIGIPLNIFCIRAHIDEKEDTVGGT